MDVVVYAFDIGERQEMLQPDRGVIPGQLDLPAFDALNNLDVLPATSAYRLIWPGVIITTVFIVDRTPCRACATSGG
jgi:hypothetical protein